MGWASYLEDISERLTDDLARLEKLVGPKGAAPVNVWVEVRTVLTKASNTVRDLQNHLDLATDPDVELSARVIELERENRRLRQELDGKSSGSRELEVKVTTLMGQLADAKSRAKESEKRNRKLQEQLTQAHTSNPGGVYNAYSTADRIKRHKPNP